MRSFTFVLVALAACVAAVSSSEIPEWSTSWNYIQRIGIPKAKRIRAAEEQYLASRITGGSPANLGEFPYQAGLLSSITDSTDQGICGGVLLSSTRVLTAAHCWDDGFSRAWQFEVILGSVLIYSGGVRIFSEDVVMHAGWSISTIRNDIAMIRLPQAVQFSNTISPAALPSGSEIFESFAGESAVASGFGFLGDGSDAVIAPNQFLSAVTLPVMTNENCRLFFPNHVVDGNICTSGAGGKNICRGDSGGPLVVNRNNTRLLVGITSFGARGCTWGFPAGFARVTYFLDFINTNM